ncbi:unnamed protein product [Symbiodinium natans]|uniref:Peptidase C14 caspase domain-containing protein n=1 Tax=Symbiodinium natans TaxID=878477 RepID=A0A812STS3_9DINO|nr:unnamed protein product [Symbiodinium natans]
MAHVHNDRVLFTIGNNGYRPCKEDCPWKALKGAVNDSHSIRNHARSAGWLVIPAQNVSNCDLMRHLAEQASYEITRTTSVVCFHYSGHCEDKDGATYLIPCDPQPQARTWRYCRSKLI